MGKFKFHQSPWPLPFMGRAVSRLLQEVPHPDIPVLATKVKAVISYPGYVWCSQQKVGIPIRRNSVTEGFHTCPQLCSQSTWTSVGQGTNSLDYILSYLLSYELTEKANEASIAFLTSVFWAVSQTCCFRFLSPLKEGPQEWFLKEIICIQNYLGSSQPGSLQEQHTHVKTHQASQATSVKQVRQMPVRPLPGCLPWHLGRSKSTLVDRHRLAV